MTIDSLLSLLTSGASKTASADQQDQKNTGSSVTNPMVSQVSATSADGSVMTVITFADGTKKTTVTGGDQVSIGNVTGRDVPVKF